MFHVAAHMLTWSCTSSAVCTMASSAIVRSEPQRDCNSKEVHIPHTGGVAEVGMKEVQEGCLRLAAGFLSEEIRGTVTPEQPTSSIPSLSPPTRQSQYSGRCYDGAISRCGGCPVLLLNRGSLDAATVAFPARSLLPVMSRELVFLWRSRFSLPALAPLLQYCRACYFKGGTRDHG